MDYQFDVFISYRRHPEWAPWTREHFRNLLDAYLRQELGDSPSIFVDAHIAPLVDTWLPSGIPVQRLCPYS
jgi:hypothetical protein